MNLIKILQMVIEVRLIADIFASVLEDEPGIEVAGFTSTLEDALEFLRTQTVDVTLVSAALPDQAALKFTRTTVEGSPSTKVLILGLSDENQHDTLRYIEAGAAGYILKDSSLKESLISLIGAKGRGSSFHPYGGRNDGTTLSSRQGVFCS
jgi:DNA-binding NarL/FixJ family response regulator